MRLAPGEHENLWGGGEALRLETPESSLGSKQTLESCHWPSASCSIRRSSAIAASIPSFDLSAKLHTTSNQAQGDWIGASSSSTPPPTKLRVAGFKHAQAPKLRVTGFKYAQGMRRSCNQRSRSEIPQSQGSSPFTAAQSPVPDCPVPPHRHLQAFFRCHPPAWKLDTERGVNWQPIGE